MGKKASFIFVIVTLVILLLALLSMFLLPQKYVLTIFCIGILLVIINMLFFIITFFIYCFKRKKNITGKFMSENFLNTLSDEEENNYVYKKFCDEGCIYMFQYINEKGIKIFVPIKASYVEIEELECDKAPYVDIYEKIYIPSKLTFIDCLHYNKGIEEAIGKRYILHINDNMIFSDSAVV